jgi:ornithine cyclodeaminase/alanine dehydrogenase-like protein (mu-crystallin family)
MLVINERVVQTILQDEPAMTLHAASSSFSKVQIEAPLRTSLSTPGNTFLTMPCAMTATNPAALLNGGLCSAAVKHVAVGKERAGLPATTLLFDDNSGAVKACVNASSLTGVRTA